MQCPACGAFIGEDDAFCGECGRPVDRKPLADVPLEAEPVQSQPALDLADLDKVVKPTAPTRPSWPLARILVGVGLALLTLSLCGLGAVFLLPEKEAVVVATATPQPTVAPTPTERTGPLRDLRSLIASEPFYSDDFSNPASGWETVEDEDTKIEYADGEFRIAVYHENYMAWSNPYPALDLSDLAIEVDARLVEGPLDNNLGLLVRCREGVGEDSDDFYWYEISSDGYYAVVMRRDEEWMTLIPWTESEAIRQGVDVVNHLQVLCADSLCSFFVNDVWLTDVVDSTILSGTIGLAAGNFDEAGVVIHFDNLVVYELQE